MADEARGDGRGDQEDRGPGCEYYRLCFECHSYCAVILCSLTFYALLTVLNVRCVRRRHADWFARLVFSFEC